MEATAAQLAELLGGTVEGDANATVNRPGKIEEGGAGTLCFLANPKYESYAYTTTATLLMVNQEFQPKKPVQPTLLRVKDVYASMAKLMQIFGQEKAKQTQLSGISSQSSVHESAEMGPGTSLGPFVVIEEGAEIGENCQIHAHAYIGKGVRIGAETIIHTGAKIYHDCQIGSKCIIHANTVIGADGFGFAPQEDGTYEKIPQLGNVVLEDEVEIGANCTIDRGSLGPTVIRKGVKLDNLIMVAHNVEIGEHTVIAAQAGIAGSTKIGARCMIGGQVGIVGHIQIADGTRIQAQSGINRTVKEENSALYGSPAIPYNDYLRAYALFRKFPDIEKRLRALEKQ